MFKVNAPLVREGMLGASGQRPVARCTTQRAILPGRRRDDMHVVVGVRTAIHRTALLVPARHPPDPAHVPDGQPAHSPGAAAFGLA